MDVIVNNKLKTHEFISGTKRVNNETATVVTIPTSTGFVITAWFRIRSFFSCGSCYFLTKPSMCGQLFFLICLFLVLYFVVLLQRNTHSPSLPLGKMENAWSYIDIVQHLAVKWYQLAGGEFKQHDDSPLQPEWPFLRLLSLVSTVLY